MSFIKGFADDFNKYHFRALIILMTKGPWGKFLSDKLFLKLKYYSILKKKLNLESPVEINEKLQWLKLFDRRPEYTMMVDKYAAKKYVADAIGDMYIIPTLGVWETFDEIDFDHLPSKFVLKCTHDSGGLIICKDKTKFDFALAKKKINKCMKRNYYYSWREWPYKNVTPKIIAEQYMEDAETVELRDYKFFCFAGKPLYCQVISDRRTYETVDYFDMDWQHQEFTGLAMPYKPFSKSSIRKPINFEKMKELSSILSNGIPFLRVDFYEVNGKIYFGELTFYPASGFGEFHPTKWNKIMGDLIVLPEKRKCN